MGPWLLPIFYANVAAHGALVVGAVWSVAMPTRRLYPMEDKSVGYYVMWFLFYFVFASNFAIALLDWNSAHWTGPARFVLAAPLVALGRRPEHVHHRWPIVHSNPYVH